MRVCIVICSVVIVGILQVQEISQKLTSQEIFLLSLHLNVGLLTSCWLLDPLVIISLLVICRRLIPGDNVSAFIRMVQLSHYDDKEFIFRREKGATSMFKIDHCVND
jgi:hypothetical protein